MHACGIAAQVPGRSVAPHSASIGKLQYWPLGHGCWPRLPQLCPVGVVPPHSPRVSTETPAAAAAHALPYYIPSQPHTGLYSSVHACGMFAQVPVASARPHIASGGKLQYWPRAHG